MDESGSFAERAEMPTKDSAASIFEGIPFIGGPIRHPVIRSGERELIEPHVRSAVYYRDMGKCHWCGHRVEGQPWHLDHILPWSAGGPDDTTNLRVLCERHNMERG